MKDIKPHNFDPTMLVLFGATGHLSANYLLPALYDMDVMGLLPDSLKIVCVGRRKLTTKSYLNFIIKKSSGLKHLASHRVRAHFFKHILYYQGDFGNPESFRGLARLLADRENPRHLCYNRLYYFATSPEYFLPIANQLKKSGLLVSCSAHDRKVRILVEKPFGFDLKSARNLNNTLLRYFTEDQIYRIDHYLGKETVQNLMVVRFANSLFEPLWNTKYIDHIEISSLYSDKVGPRAPFYDEAGALRDVVQNHILQMLALITMEEPLELKTELIRDQKLKILKSLAPISKKDLPERLVLGQYEGYSKEVGKNTRTETFAALKTYLNLPKWKGVPIYVKSGMALDKKIAEISIHYKELPKCLFRNCAANVMIFRIQPDESVFLQINNKVPGFGVELHQARLEFSYKMAYTAKLPNAYERLLLDFLQGDQRLFTRSDEIEAAWKFIDSLTKNIKTISVKKYKPGSGGPKEADALIQKDGREWWTR